MRRLACVIAMVMGAGAAMWTAAFGQAGGEATVTESGPAPKISCEQVIHDVDLRRKDAERLIVVLRVTHDPSSPMALIQRVVKAEKGADDRGNSLVPTTMPADLRPDTGSASASDLVRVVLRPPDGGQVRGEKIAFVEGVIPGSTVAKTERLELAVPGTVTRTWGSGVKGTFTAVMNGASCKVDCAFDFPPGTTEEDRQLFASQSLMVKTRVEDSGAGGAAVPGPGAAWRSGAGSSSSGTNRVSTSTTYNPPAGGGGGVGGVPRISMELIVEMKAVLIPFRVENVPLP